MGAGPRMLPPHMDRSLLLLLLLLALMVATALQPPGDTPAMCGQRRSSMPVEGEATHSARKVRCVPREELPPELKHQYTIDQVVGIVQDIKHRLGHLQVPSVEKQRKGKGNRRRPTKQLKQRTRSSLSAEN